MRGASFATSRPCNESTGHFTIFVATIVAFDGISHVYQEVRLAITTRSYSNMDVNMPNWMECEVRITGPTMRFPGFGTPISARMRMAMTSWTLTPSSRCRPSQRHRGRWAQRICLGTGWRTRTAAQDLLRQCASDGGRHAAGVAVGTRSRDRNARRVSAVGRGEPCRPVECCPTRHGERVYDRLSRLVRLAVGQLGMQVGLLRVYMAIRRSYCILHAHSLVGA